ncbi:MAG TPA: 30S ribosomal protein S12 methylthiotransferase RimO [Spirochaetia bacterium]|nr:30S ribosomal protein S12 methylthiotransferase RimO [Spirochaetia bacterium]HBI37471.1 30S ribosomal protein S12 methylthiotransferase RimO [Spirochaetia bacterium]
MIKKVYIESLGCSKNQVDSEKMAALFEEKGFSLTDQPEDADYIIVNTCGFIDSAKKEAVDVVFEMAEYKKTGKCTKLVLAGCFAQRYTEAAEKEFLPDEVDLIFGTGDISQIVDAIQQNERVVKPEIVKERLISRKIKGFPGSAYLRISDGCSNNCSYCAIPLIRGPLRSRPIDDIIIELELILKNNDIKEINIISQDTTNYGSDLTGKSNLIELLTRIDSVLDGNQWIRVLYMHPDHITEEILDGLLHIKHFIPYFDIPFQSGSEIILKKMGRVGSSKKYLDLLFSIRKRFDQAVIRSTFITGFPQESDLDHTETLNFIKQARIDWVGAFAYSDEDGTKAFEIEKKIPKIKASKRLDEIMSLSESISQESLKRFIGITTDLLVEESVDENLFLTRFWGQAPEVDGLTVLDSFTAKPGQFSHAVIKKINGKDFFASGN